MSSVGIDGLIRRVRACAHESTCESDFLTALQQDGISYRPRWSDAEQRSVIGYAVRDLDDQDEWYDAARLAPDLAITSLRHQWQQGPDEEWDALSYWRPRRGPLAAQRTARMETVGANRHESRSEAPRVYPRTSQRPVTAPEPDVTRPRTGGSGGVTAIVALVAVVTLALLGFLGYRMLENTSHPSPSTPSLTPSAPGLSTRNLPSRTVPTPRTDRQTQPPATSAPTAPVQPKMTAQPPKQTTAPAAPSSQPAQPVPSAPATAPASTP